MLNMREFRHYCGNVILVILAMIGLSALAIEYFGASVMLCSVSRRGAAQRIKNDIFGRISLTGHLPNIEIAKQSGIPVLSDGDVWETVLNYEEILNSVPENPVILIVEWQKQPTSTKKGTMLIDDRGIWIQDERGKISLEAVSMDDFFVIRLRQEVEYVRMPLSGIQLKRFLTGNSSE